jgi:hypothetical protein
LLFMARHTSACVTVWIVQVSSFCCNAAGIPCPRLFLVGEG